ncbi:22322_t:CDS:2 [Gigaspora margarita]|uniref:22322_t:CDS:1 n=1 Tax=Gigaspora margarita TaxID=4874 RepID=A0ABN7UFE6_GIGMA|nr:22322_t:CDS:2 [Gigaspora margarita]
MALLRRIQTFTLFIIILLFIAKIANPQPQPSQPPEPATPSRNFKEKIQPVDFGPRSDEMFLRDLHDDA